MNLHLLLQRLAAVMAAAVSVPVDDGPWPTSQGVRDFVLVGSDGSDGVDIPSASVSRQSSDLGPGGWDDETAEIPCVAVSQAGSAADLMVCRSTALGLYESCRAAIRVDRTLSGLLAAGGQADVTGYTLYQDLTDRGPVVRVVFNVQATSTATAL